MAPTPPSPSDPAVVRKGAFNTPWRTLQIADDAAGLYMSDLVLNLNEPNRLDDVSWVKPSKFVGVWWLMHLNSASWAAGPKHAATTANTRKYIDFAATNGFRGVLVEGWTRAGKATGAMTAPTSASPSRIPTSTCPRWSRTHNRRVCA
jgi:alpha-glucosidase